MKISRLVLFAVVMTAFSAASAYALPTVQVTWAPNHSPTAGEFILATNNIGTFNSFCIEKDEFVSLGSTYYYTVSDSADNGGVNTNANDAISKGTAWLFSQFATGALSQNHGYQSTHAQQTALQEAFWLLEQEIVVANPAANFWINLMLNQTGLSFATAQNDSQGAYGVGVMNLWTNANGTGYAQDQLMMVPDGGTTLTLLGLAFGGMALISRRVRRA
jgi:hypothetical protein